MSAGRIESYIHSDSITPNKGGVLVRVTSQTDFAAKTDEFIAFSIRVAKAAYAVGGGRGGETTSWKEVVELFPDLEQERQALESKLREKVTVAEIVVLLL